ncbi:ankyrin repeat domain-containing protein [Endozoicomonas sp. ALC020]|uniref:ankyrin repeat domain-containing protein n=1 Tax=unclassified Endozoicomonas TaxID=2644528 RepID=UPI003BB02D6D
MKTPSYLAASATLAAFIHCNTTMAWTSVRANSDSVRPNSKVLQLYRNSADGDEINYIYFDIDKRRLLWKVAKNAGHEETYEQPLPDFIGSVSASVFKGNHLYIAGQLQYKQEWFISALNPNGEVIWVRQGNDNDPSGMPKDITFYKIMTMAEEKVIYAVGKTPSTQIVLELNSENGSDVSGEVFNKFSNRKLLHTSSNSTDDEVISKGEERHFRNLEWIAGVFSIVGGIALVSAFYAGWKFLKNINEERKSKITRAKDIESNRRKIEGDLMRKIERKKTSFLFMPHESYAVILPDISVIDNPEGNTDADCAEQEQLFQHLLRAVLQGNAEEVGSLLETSPGLIHQRDSSENTLLHIAITTNNSEIIQFLLSKGINYDARNLQDFTPLHVAAIQGDTNALETLLKAGADIELLVNQQHSPLHLAIINNHPEAVKLLIKSRARFSERLRIINQGDYQGNTPLHLAVLAKNANVVNLLLSHGASQELSNNDGFTPLYLAAVTGAQDAIRVLLDWKSAFSQDELSALFHIAANFNNESLIKDLLSRGLHYGLKFYQPCMPDTIDQFCVQTQSGLTVLHEAVLANSYSVVRFLLRVRLIEINAKDDQGNTSLHYAIQNNDIKMIAILLSKGADINIMNRLGYTPLHFAVQLENQEAIKLLIQKCANLNIRDNKGQTPLHVALRVGNQEAIKSLIQEGANLQLTDNNNESVLDLATTIGNQAAVLLIQNKIESSKPNETKSDSEQNPPVVIELQN